MVCLDASFVPGIWGKAIILNSIRRKFWVWLKQKKEIQNLPEFVGRICEAKILATNSISKGVIFQFHASLIISLLLGFTLKLDFPLLFLTDPLSIK